MLPISIICLLKYKKYVLKTLSVLDSGYKEYVLKKQYMEALIPLIDNIGSLLAFSILLLHSRGNQ